MKLFLIRHGQTQANVDRIYSGQSDDPLTQVGKEQALALQSVLAEHSFDRVYSSDLSRAIETQRLALPGVEGQRTALLREISVGDAAGHPYGCVPGLPAGWNSAKDPKGYARVGGESMEDLYNRIRTFLGQLEENPCEKVVAFVHNGVICAMMRIVLGTEFDRSVLFSDNSAIHIFDFDGKKWRLLAWNYMRKL